MREQNGRHAGLALAHASQPHPGVETRSWGILAVLAWLWSWVRPVVSMAPPLPADDPADVRYSVARRGRVVMAGTAPSEDEARRLAFGEGVG